MKLKTLFVLSAIALLAGCASGGMKPAELKASMPVLKPDEGRVYFYRNASMFGAAIQPDIKVGDTVVGTSRPGGFFFVDRPAGDYEAHASTEVERKLSFALAPGENKYIRTSPSFGIMVGRINFELVNAPEAEGEMASLSYTGTVGAKE